MKTGDKRKHSRILSRNLSYICLDEDQKTVKQGMGRTLNVSESGILLETHFPIAAEHTVILSIGLEDDLVDVKGRLVHIATKPNGVYEVGIEFINPGKKAQSIIHQFVRQHKGTTS